MPQCWQIISLSQERSERELQGGSTPVLTWWHATRVERGQGGKGLRVNIMHAWLPPSTQHQHGTTRTGLTQRISSGSTPPPTLNPFRNWTWLDWKFVFTVLHLNFGGFRFCGFRLSVVGCRLSIVGWVRLASNYDAKFIVCHVCGCMLCRFVSSVLATNNFDSNCIANHIN